MRANFLRLRCGRGIGRVLGFAVFLPAMTAVGQDEVTCATCHPARAEEVGKSIHGALGCQECHQGEQSYDLTLEQARRHLATADSPLPFDHGPSFGGMPERARIPFLCGNCHSDVERMNPYGFRTDQLARYWTSGHGKALKNGDEKVAVCIDCHGVHSIQGPNDPASKSHPLNVPDTCSVCHGDSVLMAEYDLPVAVVDEYRQSIHGRLLFEQQDTGAPTCATCHGNHSAMPPGFATVGEVCGQCHQHAAEDYRRSVHASLPEYKGCVQCHGGGEERHFHYIERITKPTSLMIQRYARLVSSGVRPTPEEITQTIHPDPKEIIERALTTCLDCHEELEDDESLPKLFALLDDISEAERNYAITGQRLDAVGTGVLLVDNQRFLFEDAKTFLIELAPLQHSLDNKAVAEKVEQLNAVCKKVNDELDELEYGLRWRYRALVPIWIFSILFSLVLYIKYKRLKAEWVKPLPPELGGN